MAEINQATNEMSLADRTRIGKRLIIAAWGVEIIAAGIGMLIAVLIIISTQAQIQGLDGEVSAAGGIMSAFLGGLPFIMVAVVELTKIPLATACFHARSQLWKIALGFGLLFLMVITFETILNGFERNFTQRTYIIKQLKKQLIHTNEELEKVDRDVENLSAITASNIRNEFDREIDQIDRNRIQELEDIEKQIQQARITHSGRQAEVLREQKTANDEELKRLDDTYAEDKERINAEFEKKTSLDKSEVTSQQENLRQRILSVQSDIEKLDGQKQSELALIKDPKDNSSALAEEIKRIENDFTSRISKLETTLSKEREGAEERINNLRSEIAGVQDEKATAIKNLSFFTTEEEKRALVNRFDIQIDSLQTELENLQSRAGTIDTTERISELQKEKDNQIEKTRNDFQNAAASGQKARNEVNEKYRRETQDLRDQLKSLGRRLANLSAQSLIREAANERDQKFKSTTNDYRERREELTTRGDQLSKQLAAALSENKDKLQPILDGLQSQRSQISERYSELRRKAQERYAAKQEDLKNRETRIDALKARSAELGQQRLSLRDEISKNAEDSQIYRVTALWVGKDSPADITNEELRTVSFIWFGSLAAITAWTGTLLAFAGLAVRYGHRSRNPHLGGTFRAIRGLFVDLRRKARKPRILEVEKEIIKTVEVQKEVPVDKVVFKEVPKEVVRKELVYVPFFTDDPEILSKTVGEFGLAGSKNQPDEPDLPPESGGGESNAKAAAE